MKTWCSKCGEKFERRSRIHRVCPDCIAKIRKKAGKKIKGKSRPRSILVKKCL